MWKSLIESYLLNALISYYSISPLSLFLIGGDVENRSSHSVGDNEPVNVGDEWSMELDQRSFWKSKRTLHWFVRGKQQKVFIKGVPDRVEFGV